MESLPDPLPAEPTCTSEQKIHFQVGDTISANQDRTLDSSHLADTSKVTYNKCIQHTVGRQENY